MNAQLEAMGVGIILDGTPGFLVEPTPPDQNIKVSATIDVTTQKAASQSITITSKAIEKVSAERAKMGAVQNRLEHTINNLTNSAENLTSAESRIRDVDLAKEMMELTKHNILEQASQAMLAQANQVTQNVLSLLK